METSLWTAATFMALLGGSAFCPSMSTCGQEPLILWFVDDCSANQSTAAKSLKLD